MPALLTGQPVMGFSNPSTFFFGFGTTVYQISGLGFSMHETPVFNTLSSSTASGRDVRVSLYQNPLHSWKLVWNFLEAQTPGFAGNPTTATDLQTFYSFYTAMTGKFSEFLYKPRDSAITGQVLLQPDTNGFVELVHSLGPFFSESIQELNGATPTIKLTVTSPPGTSDITSTCTFYAADSVAPYSGIAFTTATSTVGGVISSDYNYFYRVRFDEDKYDFEEFIYLIMKTGIGMSQIRI